ncbi:hypothetical protein PVAP13_2KG260058 [Panicum virgatum]|uniref:Uncharacterized protein n=1 Tax=Panicum virgatum TaxID=38727 RepID=A0A8T0W455_PANVG|nr:hypothetical protein PVAP13_2KG260058 [Panicum virgatum]
MRDVRRRAAASLARVLGASDLSAPPLRRALPPGSAIIHPPLLGSRRPASRRGRGAVCPRPGFRFLLRSRIVMVAVAALFRQAPSSVGIRRNDVCGSTRRWPHEMADH